MTGILWACCARHTLKPRPGSSVTPAVNMGFCFEDPEWLLSQSHRPCLLIPASTYSHCPAASWSLWGLALPSQSAWLMGLQTRGDKFCVETMACFLRASLRVSESLSTWPWTGELLLGSRGACLLSRTGSVPPYGSRLESAQPSMREAP